MKFNNAFIDAMCRIAGDQFPFWMEDEYRIYKSHLLHCE